MMHDVLCLISVCGVLCYVVILSHIVCGVVCIVLLSSHAMCGGGGFVLSCLVSCCMRW